MRMNQKMKELLSEMNSEKGLDVNRSNSNKGFCEILDSGFVEIDGAILLAACAKLATSVRFSNFPDLTGYECFVNHIHVEDYSDLPSKDMDLLRAGLSFANDLNEKVRSSFSNRKFKIIISHGESSCVVRFHQLRGNETWLADDLEQYKDDAIMVL